MLVSVSQLAAHAGIATFILLILLHSTLASILILRFVHGCTLNPLGSTTTYSNELFMCHRIPLLCHENTRLATSKNDGRTQHYVSRYSPILYGQKRPLFAGLMRARTPLPTFSNSSGVL
jgi:hypothetical protein